MLVMVNEQHKKLSPFCLHHLIHQQHPSVVRFPPNAKHRWPIFMLMFGAGAVCTGLKQLYSEGNFTYAPYEVSIPIVCSHGSAPNGSVCARVRRLPIAQIFRTDRARFLLPVGSFRAAVITFVEEDPAKARQETPIVTTKWTDHG